MRKDTSEHLAASATLAVEPFPWLAVAVMALACIAIAVCAVLEFF